MHISEEIFEANLCIYCSSAPCSHLREHIYVESILQNSMIFYIVHMSMTAVCVLNAHDGTHTPNNSLANLQDMMTIYVQ